MSRTIHKKEKTSSTTHSSMSEQHALRVSSNKAARRASTSSAVGLATKEVFSQGTVRRRRSTIPSLQSICTDSLKGSSGVSSMKDGSASLLLNAKDKKMCLTGEQCTSPKLPASSSNILPPAMKKGSGVCDSRGASLPGSAAARPSATVTHPRGRQASSSCLSAVEATAASSSSGSGAATIKGFSPGSRGRFSSTRRRSSTRGSAPPHLPAMQKCASHLEAAGKNRTGDNERNMKVNSAHPHSTTTHVTSLPFSVPTANGASSDAFPVAVQDTLPPLRPLSGADYGAHSTSSSQSQQQLRSTLSNTEPSRFSGCTHTGNTKTPVSSASSHFFPRASPLPSLTASPSSERRAINRLSKCTNVRSGVANGDQSVHRSSVTDSMQSVVLDREGEDDGEVTLSKVEVSSRLSRAEGEEFFHRHEEEAEEEDRAATSTVKQDYEEEEEEGEVTDADEEDEHSEGDSQEEAETSYADDTSDGTTDSSGVDDDGEEGDDEEGEDEEGDDCVSTPTSSSSSGDSSVSTVDDAKKFRTGGKRCGDVSKPRSDMAKKKALAAPSASKTVQSVRGSNSTAQKIRTKVSREGDVNVKVIFAVRTRNCFRRYLRELMTRFGFQKVTDFDMYCIDQYGDRVDIDMEDDFDQLLDTFMESISAGRQSVDNSPHPSTSPRSPPMSSAGLVPHAQSKNKGKSNSGMSAPGEIGSTNVLCSGRSGGSATSNSHAFPSQGTRLSAMASGLDATAVWPTGAGSVMEDDGKSSGSALRLYVRYSNAYYTEHRQEFEQQQQQQRRIQQLALYPPSIFSDDGSGACLLRPGISPVAGSLPTNHPQLSLGSSAKKQGFTMDQLLAGRLSTGPAGSPLAWTVRSSTVGSADDGGRWTGRPGSLEELDALHGHTTEVPGGSSASASVQMNDTLHSAFTNTFQLEEDGQVDWRRMSVLGKGSFGTVYEGITQDGRMLAVKVQELPLDDGEDAEAVKALKMEINLMRSLKHKNIVTYYGCQIRVLPTGNQQMEVFLELCHGGSLASLRRKLLKAKQPFSISLVRSYTRQVLEGLAYLHAQNVVHRDIKSDNVLISAMGEAKLADFGCSKRVGPATLQTMSGRLPPDSVGVSREAAAAHAAMYQSVVGSPLFMAPEVLREDGGYTRAADIWSVGCLVLELLGREPWDITGTNIFQIMFRISKEKGMPTGVPKPCPKVLLDFLERCFQRDAKQRATAAELLAHTWLTCHDKMLEEVSPSP